MPTWEGPKRVRYGAGATESGSAGSLPDSDYKYYQTIGDPGKITFSVMRGLDEYYEATGEKPDSKTWSSLTRLFIESLCGSDWPSGLWTIGNTPELPPQARSVGMDLELPPRSVNRHLGNLIGFLRTAGSTTAGESALIVCDQDRTGSHSEERPG